MESPKFQGMTKKELIEKLKEYNAKVTGNKAELVKRLSDYYATKGPPTETRDEFENNPCFALCQA